MKNKGQTGIFTLATILCVVFVILISITGSYNSFVQGRNICSTMWSQVETQYQRRFDLIPNLTNAAKGYIMHEEKIFADIAQARTHYAGAVGEAKIGAQGQLDSALARLMVIMENYPNLKADQTIRDLMYELSGTENRINVARQRYNESVQSYNTSIQSLPGVFIANMYRFNAKELYQSKAGSDIAPVVNLEVK